MVDRQRAAPGAAILALLAPALEMMGLGGPFGEIAILQTLFVRPRHKLPLDERGRLGAIVVGPELLVAVGRAAVFAAHALDQIGLGRADEPLEARVERGQALVLERERARLLRKLVVQAFRGGRALLGEALDGVAQDSGEVIEHVALAQMVPHDLERGGVAILATITMTKVAFHVHEPVALRLFALSFGDKHVRDDLVDLIQRVEPLHHVPPLRRVLDVDGGLSGDEDLRCGRQGHSGVRSTRSSKFDA